MTPNRSRKHHYVPTFHLKEFTQNVSRTDRLYVLDRKRQKTWSGTPESVGSSSDYNRTYFGNGIDPLIAENTFANDFENDWSLAVRRTIALNNLPEDEDLGHLILFVSFAAARSPYMRDALYVELQDSHSHGEDELDRFSAEYRNHEIEMTFALALNMQQCIQSWNWYLCKVENGCPDLICSDMPVFLTNTKSRGQHFPYACGMPDKMLTMPLGKRHLLVAHQEDFGIVEFLDAKQVAITNAKTAYHAGQIFSGTYDFVWYTNEGTIAGVQSFKKAHNWVD